MDDPVAEVLAQRASMERGASAAIVISLLGHAALSGVAVWAAFRQPTQNMPAVMNIRFAKIPAPAPVIAAAPPPVAQPPASAPAIQPVAAAPLKAAKPVLPSPFGKSTKKATEGPAPAPAPAPVVETPPQSDVVLEGGDFPYTIYTDRMKTLIGTRWFRPQVASGVTATIYFVIDRDGTLRDAAIEKPSGNGTFDRGALRAVLESSPLPPLPFGYSGTYLGVHLTFR